MLGNIYIILKRETKGYFSTPLAYIFISIFCGLTAAFTFYLGAFLERGQADLFPFFESHPWLLVLLVPSISMRLWAEERKTGSIELLMTLPITTFEAVLGKYLAAWFMIAIALVLTFPMWLTVNILGSPDNGVVLSSYLGSWLLAGQFLAIGSALSAMTKNQVIAFVISTAACFLFVMSGVEAVTKAVEGFVPEYILSIFSSMSSLDHFYEFVKGVIDLRSLMFYGSSIIFWLFINIIIINIKKAA